MKIHIFYRHYLIEGNDKKNRPEWFNFEKCFVNLLTSIETYNIDLHVIMDGSISKNWIRKYKDKFTSHEIQAGNDYESAMQTYHLANSIISEDNDIFYFLENDYLHQLDWVEKIIDLFSTYSNLSYVSLYDHNDKYFLPMYNNLVSKIFTTSTSHWRTTPSTCGTYLIKTKLFKEDFDTHIGMEGDHNKYIWLNQNKDRFVITPIPGLSTHCMEGLMSPTINWEEYV